MILALTKSAMPVQISGVGLFPPISSGKSDSRRGPALSLTFNQVILMLHLEPFLFYGLRFDMNT